MGLTSLDLDAFNARIELIPFSDCHYWTGELNGNGYGIFNRRRAHRIAFERAKGPIPRIGGQSAHLLHSCDNPMCVNPAHLRPGTHAENMADAADRGRFPLGEKHHNNKLKDADLVDILAALDAGEQTGAIATRYGVSKSRISSLRFGRVGINHPAHGRKATGRCDRRLTDDQVLRLYRRATGGESPTGLARELGLTYSFVQDVKRGNTYARVTGHRS